MPPSRDANRTRTVFIGNISFEASEEELHTLFGSVGPVVNLRLVVDRDTGKRKGFGFVEYADQETALSAVRNLNELDLHGRQLRVNIAEQDTKTTNAEASLSKKRKGGPPGAGGPPWDGAAGGGYGGGGGDPRSAPGGGGAFADPRQAAHAAIFPDLPETYLPPTTDPIASYVEKLGRHQMFELALQAKHFTMSQPDEAASLLANNPPAIAALHLVIDRLAGPHWPPPLPEFSGPLTRDYRVLSIEQPREAGAGAVPVLASAAGGSGFAAEVVATAAAPPTAPSAGGQSFPPALEAAAAAMGVPTAVLHDQITQLTPEAMLALPPEQQQQVRELQQML